MKPYILKALVVAAVILLIGTGLYLYSSRTSASLSCYANAGEVCPSEEWLSEYKEAANLQKEITALSDTSAMKKLRAKSDQFRGMGQRLGQAMPQGYQFDEKSMKFVTNKVEPPQPARTIDAPPTATPTPAPPK